MSAIGSYKNWKKCVRHGEELLEELYGVGKRSSSPLKLNRKRLDKLQREIGENQIEWFVGAVIYPEKGVVWFDLESINEGWLFAWEEFENNTPLLKQELTKRVLDTVSNAGMVVKINALGYAVIPKQKMTKEDYVIMTYFGWKDE